MSCTNVGMIFSDGAYAVVKQHMKGSVQNGLELGPEQGQHQALLDRGPTARADVNRPDSMIAFPMPKWLEGRGVILRHNW